MTTVHSHPGDDDEIVDAEVIDINHNLEAFGQTSAWKPPEAPEALEAATHSETGRTTKAIKDVIEQHERPVDEKLHAVGEAKAKVVQKRGVAEAAIGRRNQALVNVEQARTDDETARKNPHRHAVREVGTVTTAIVAVATAVFAFLVDRVQMRAVFSFETIGVVSLIALAVGATQAITGHFAGDMHSAFVFAPKDSLTDTEWRTFKRSRSVAATIGIGSNVALAVLRAARGGGVFVAMLLMGVGIALWLMCAIVAYKHNSKSATAVVRGEKEFTVADGEMNVTLHDVEKAEENYGRAEAGLRAAADIGVQDVDNEIVHLHARLARAGLPAYTPKLPRTYYVWKAIADGEDANARPLPEWKRPTILDANRRHHTPPPEQLALPRGDS
jgi:hypothetical protein